LLLLGINPTYEIEYFFQHLSDSANHQGVDECNVFVGRSGKDATKTLAVFSYYFLLVVRSNDHYQA